MFDGQHDDVQSLRFSNPYPEMPVLYTPDQFRVGNRTLRIPTPPVTERPVDDGHLSLLRKRRVSGQVVDSVIELRCDRQGCNTVQPLGTTVINDAIQRGDLNAPVVSVINGAQLPDSKRKSVESNLVNDPFRNNT